MFPVRRFFWYFSPVAARMPCIQPNQTGYSMLQALIDWLLATILKLGYSGIFLLMAMESSVIPIPSELVMPPAGYWAAEGKMNIVIAIICGTIGSLLGAYANYFAAH